MLSFLDARLWFQNCHQMMDKLSSNNALISEFCEIFVSLFYSCGKSCVSRRRHISSSLWGSEYSQKPLGGRNIRLFHKRRISVPPRVLLTPSRKGDIYETASWSYTGENDEYSPDLSRLPWCLVIYLCRFLLYHTNLFEDASNIKQRHSLFICRIYNTFRPESWGEVFIKIVLL